MTCSTGLKKNTFYKIIIGRGQIELELTTKRL